MNSNQVISAFNSIISDWEKLRPNSTSMTYEEIQGFVYSFTKEIDETYPLHGEATNQFHPFIFLLHFTVAFNRLSLDKISSCFDGNCIHTDIKRENKKRGLYDLVVLQLWRQKDYMADNIVRSFCIGREFQAFQQLRIYIENCLILFLLLTDKAVFEQYLVDDLSVEEFNKFWWKHLRPSKVSRKIKTNKSNVEAKERETGMVGFDVRKRAPGDNLEHFIQLYDRCNDYIHLKKSVLLSHAYEEKKKGFRINTKYDWSDSSQQVVLTLIETLSYSSSWLHEALACHIDIFNSKNSGCDDDQLDQLIKFIHDMFVRRCVINGMYEYAKK